MGATCTMVSHETFCTLLPTNAPKLQPNDIYLRTWSGQSLEVLGTATVDVKHSDKMCQLPLIVVNGSGCSLLGRNWFAKLGIHIGGIHQSTEHPRIAEVLQEYREYLRKTYLAMLVYQYICS